MHHPQGADMTERPTSSAESRSYEAIHTPGVAGARHQGAGARGPGRLPTGATPQAGRGAGHVYDFQIATNGGHFRVELLRVSVGFFGRVRREHVGVTDGPFETLEDAEAALARRWEGYWRAAGQARAAE
jgi:hypothetical protein